MLDGTSKWMAVDIERITIQEEARSVGELCKCKCKCKCGVRLPGCRLRKRRLTQPRGSATFLLAES